MAAVNVLNIELNGANPALTSEPISFTVTFEALEALKEDIEWRLLYVGPGDTQDRDTELDEVCVGPVARGQMRFVFQTDAPDLAKMLEEEDEVLGYHAILLSGYYNGHEFVRVGYYVQNLYDDPTLNEDPPCPPRWNELKRLVYADEPRMTKFVIDWDKQEDFNVEGMGATASEAENFSGPKVLVENSNTVSYQKDEL